MFPGVKSVVPCYKVSLSCFVHGLYIDSTWCADYGSIPCTIQGITRGVGAYREMLPAKYRLFHDKGRLKSLPCFVGNEEISRENL